LTEPKNAIVKQYQRFFQMENSSLQFEPDAMRAIARKAIKRDVGARALRAVVEELMLPLMYELPEAKDEGATYVITEAMVEGTAPASLFTARKAQKESA
jgi:ATP-dependent Clp protease ATP-binding subunit ClpX